MDHKFELNEDELEVVVGGNDLGANAKIGNVTFTGRVDMYQGKIGQCYYVVDDDKKEWYYGRLVDTFEAEFTFYTERTHVFRLEEHNGVPCGGVKEVSGDDYTLYISRA